MRRSTRRKKIRVRCPLSISQLGPAHAGPNFSVRLLSSEKMKLFRVSFACTLCIAAVLGSAFSIGAAERLTPARLSAVRDAFSDADRRRFVPSAARHRARVRRLGARATGRSGANGRSQNPGAPGLVGNGEDGCGGGPPGDGSRSRLRRRDCARDYGGSTERTGTDSRGPRRAAERGRDRGRDGDRSRGPGPRTIRREP